jgi:hypothetical protein
MTFAQNRAHHTSTGCNANRGVIPPTVGDGRRVDTFNRMLDVDMHNAFDKVCAKLRLAPTADKATELVATKIVELAKTGRRGDDLADQALRFFDAPKAH